MTVAQGIVALVPMKPLRLGKTRLSGHLTPSDRATLSLNMLGVVVESCVKAELSHVWVLGGDDTVECQAIELGVQWRDDNGVGLNLALAQAFEWVFAKGLTACYLSADLPFVTPEDVLALVELSEIGQRLTLSPARRDGGTNAMIVPVDSVFRPALGAGSFRRHRQLAATLGIQPRLYDSPGLGLDLDTADDLKDYQEMRPDLMDQLIGREL